MAAYRDLADKTDNIETGGGTRIFLSIAVDTDYCMILLVPGE